MKKILYLLPVVMLALFSGCEDYNDKHFDGLDDMNKPTNSPKLTYTLVKADYTTIADNATNKNIAKKAEEEQGIAGAIKALAAMKTSLGFSEIIASDTYMPAFLATKWYTMSDGASVLLTFDKTLSLPEYVLDFAAGDLHTFTLEDYKTVWGDKSELNFFTPAKPAARYVASILKAAHADAKSGDYVYASYNESENEPADVTVAFKEDFETTTAKSNIKLEDWANVTVTGTFKWQAQSFSGNLYAQQSGNKHAKGDLDSYLISKEILIEKGMTLSFDALYAYIKADGRLKVLVSTNLADTTSNAIAAATWSDLTSKFTIPESPDGKGDMENAGIASLADYVGKKVRIAFRYQGDNVDATTTIRIDNVTVSTPGKNVYSVVNKLYSYNGTAWSAYTKSDIRVLSQADFVEMGSKFDNFSSSMNPDNYLPTFLNSEYPYAQNEIKLAVAYKYYASSVTTIRVDEYIRNNGVWEKNGARETVTEQFVYASGKWMFDPSITHTITKGNGDLQIIVDWVAANKGEKYYQENPKGGYYTNAEYWFGASEHYGNFEMRTDTRRAEDVKRDKTFEGKSDEEVEKIIYAKLKDAFYPLLERRYPQATPKSNGADVYYTVNFETQTNGGVKKRYTVKYQCTEIGKFTYVEGPTEVK